MDKSSKNIKFGFIIFIALVIFCIAQLAWWVIFQIGQSASWYKSQIEYRQHEIEMAAKNVNSEFTRIVDQINFFLSLQSSPDILNQNLQQMLNCPAVSGYVYIADNDKTYDAGIVDSTFYAPVGSNITIYFNKHYLFKILDYNPYEISFDSTTYQGGQDGNWINANNLSLTNQLIERLADESHKTVKMFASEGSIFLLIMIFGAYLIYRTLKRTEELKTHQTNFMNAVTHELKTPLTSIRLYLETLQNADIDKAKVSNIYSNMIGDCDRLDGMVDNVLEASRIDSSEFKIELSYTSLSDDINDYLDSFENYVRQQNGKVIREIKPGINAKTNYSELNRVIKLLIENGLKYSTPNRRIINLKLENIKEKARITITDKGFGIKDGEINNIFKRFYRINNSDTKVIKGTGLGLFIAKQIIKAHHGTITAKSAGLKQGTSFIIELPMVTK